MHNAVMRLGSILLALSALACGDTPGMGGDAGGACSVDEDCSDGVFCNGAERCMPGDGAADRRGCVPASAPCDPEAQICAEETDRCETNCDVALDFDGDGVDAVECGGEDCDDGDDDRFPGNPEICDSAGVDEDCDPSTLGGADLDGDGFEDLACCNTQADGTLLCGDDCDDSEASVRPDQVDNTCDGVDNDCDGDIDENGTPLIFVRDTDGDGYGDESRGSMEICAASMEGWSRLSGDCDDDDATIYPEAPQLCDRIENRCAEGGGDPRPSEDVDDDGFAAMDADCEGGPLPKTDCDDDSAERAPDRSERCFIDFGSSDDDCDAVVDEGCPSGITVGDPESAPMRLGMERTEDVLVFDESCSAGTGLFDLGVADSGFSNDLGLYGECSGPELVDSPDGTPGRAQLSPAGSFNQWEAGDRSGPEQDLGCGGPGRWLTGIEVALEAEGVTGLRGVCQRVRLDVEDGVPTFIHLPPSFSGKWGDGPTDTLQCPNGSVISRVSGIFWNSGDELSAFGIHCRPFVLVD